MIKFIVAIILVGLTAMFIPQSSPNKPIIEMNQEGYKFEKRLDENGLIHGWSRSWHPNGILYEESYYEHGVKTKGKSFYGDGELHQEWFEDHNYELRGIVYLKDGTIVQY